MLVNLDERFYRRGKKNKIEKLKDVTVTENIEVLKM